MQVIPRAWLEAAARTADLVKACSPPEDWCYGYAFWCNDYNRRWPGLRPEHEARSTKRR